mmetsp:Transcript_12041/g.17652  ORF Transcript_12041/g.17652 Transcript_12041/m.17652 type:complete len:622 (-) Transcript_12041:419-2284(-)
MVTKCLAQKVRLQKFLNQKRLLVALGNGSSSIFQKPHLNCSGRFFASAEPSSEKTVNFGTSFVGREDHKREEQKRRRLSDVPISDVLEAKNSRRWVDPVIERDSKLRDAIIVCIEGGLSGMMVVHDKHVVGLVTARDLIRIAAHGLRDNEDPKYVMDKIVGDFMTPISQVIYARPEETIGMCRTIMAKLGIKCIPILGRKGKVEGLITSRDMSDYGLEAEEKGGKKSYLNNISERVGLSSNTSMAEPPAYLQAHLALEQTPLHCNIGVDMLPHPFKTEHGVASNRRDYGPDDLSMDPEWSEDAYFVEAVKMKDEKGEGETDVVYAGVADGVGSWREYGVDPRLFSHKLMEECSNILQEASVSKKGGEKFRRIITPSEIIAQAHERVKAQNIIGSTTACVALFDKKRHQLHFSNLGDCGLIVLRHIDSNIAGALKRDKTKPRTERTSDLRVAFVSQQQLLSFNHPYQLGWTGKDLEEGESDSFKSACDSCTTSIHIRRGDIIILATDGLFDNLDVDDICSMALEWEQECGFIRSGDIISREKRWAMGNSLTGISAEKISDLAQRLTLRARENSLDNSIDSPFALLAKENDIMWSGGMPDDCSTIVIHVVGKAADDTMNQPSM